MLQPGNIPQFHNEISIDTLTWRTRSEPSSAFGFYNQGDSLAVWFDPQRPCSLKALRVYSVNYEGGSVWSIRDGSRYDGHIYSPDSTDSNGWVGNDDHGLWEPGPILGHSPLGKLLWGPYPVTIHKPLSNSWVEIMAESGLHGEIDLGDDPFFVTAALFVNDGDGFGAESEGHIPFHFFKYYSYNEGRGNPGPDGQHFGWFLRSNSIWVEAIVKYYEPPSSVEEQQHDFNPSTYILYQNYPNPFNASTGIRYQISDKRSSPFTSLKIYNILGQEVRTVCNEEQDSGQHVVSWDGTDNKGVKVNSGVYFYQLSNGKNGTQTRRMMLLR